MTKQSLIKNTCRHEKTHFIDWPDGGTVEICDDCKYSRHHWEQGNSGWILVKDVDKARDDLNKSIEEIVKNVKPITQ